MALAETQREESTCYSMGGQKRVPWPNPSQMVTNLRANVSVLTRIFRSPYDSIQICSVTQKDQDEADEKARQKAMKDLVQSWMDRLQLISVIVR